VTWSATLKIEPETLQVNGASATGAIWMDFNGEPFPADGWNDLIVVVTGWWVGALLRLVSGERSRENVPFMDGPYSVEVSIDPSRMLRFRGLRSGRQTASCEELARDFIPALIAQSRALLYACRQQGFCSKDVEELQFQLKLLEGGA
jgi:hypothetical protein